MMSVNLTVGALQALLQRDERVLVGQVEGQVVELAGGGIGYAGRPGEGLDRGVRVLEEGDGALRPSSKK